MDSTQRLYGSHIGFCIGLMLLSAALMVTGAGAVSIDCWVRSYRYDHEVFGDTTNIMSGNGGVLARVNCIYDSSKGAYHWVWGRGSKRRLPVARRYAVQLRQHCLPQRLESLDSWTLRPRRERL